MDYAQFALAITGLSHADMTFKTRGLEKVGKKRILEKRSIVCPLCDSNFISGMQSGYRFGAEHDRSGFNATVEHYRKEGRHGGEELKRLNANQIKSREGE